MPAHRTALWYLITVWPLAAWSQEQATLPAPVPRSEHQSREVELADEQIQSVWRQFCESLRSADRAGALLHLTDSSQELYREALASLGDVIRELPNAWSRPQLLRLHEDGLAEYLVTETLEERSSVHVVIFVKSRDGLWQIEQF